MPSHVYILSNASRVLYIGVTADLRKRLERHKQRQGSTFTSKYRLDRLVYCEAFSRIVDAIVREKQLKGWLRSRKIALIEALNPDWKDLSDEV